MRVFRSRFTPGITDASEVHLQIGEIATYKDGDRSMEVEITSEVMSHPDHKTNGYEVKSCTTGQPFFAVGTKLVFDPYYWENKR